MRLAGWVVGFALVLVACAGGSDGAATDPAGPRTDVPTADSTGATAGGVRPFIADALGDLAVDRTRPTLVSFGPEASSFSLDDGGSIEVPVGAFEADTEVSVSSFDLAFDQFVDPSPTASLHVFATSIDVELAVPLAVIVPAAEDDVTVLRLVDDEWIRQDVAAGGDIRIEIDHFSEVAVAVVSDLDAVPTTINDLPDGDSPADFLRACVFMVSNLYGPDAADDEQVEFATDLAFSICTTALVRRSSPTGVNVSVACVGDNIGGDVDFQGAIDLCVAQSDNDQPAQVPDPTQASDAAPPQLTWSGEMLATADFVENPLEPGIFDMTRTAGTNEFAIEIQTATRKTGEFTLDGFNAVECTATWTDTFTGTGTYWSIDNTRIEFTGQSTLEIVYVAGPCSENPEPNTRDFSGVQAIITEAGVEGELGGWTFNVTGQSPEPIG